MKVIKAKNINEALALGSFLMAQEGILKTSRNGKVLEFPEPVCTLYQQPMERMLINPIRKANPFFHLHEAMWILAGRKDVDYLSYFIPRMAEFSDDGKEFNAPYGYRLRQRYGKDQITEAIKLLREHPDTRRAVLQIWSPEDDLNVDSKDLACNTTVYFKINFGMLDMTVCCRSNDMLWGAYGANAVQFSILQEYVASMVGAKVGVYRQISDSLHVYLDGPGGELWEKVKRYITPATFVDPYYDYKMIPNFMVHDRNAWDNDLKWFMELAPDTGISQRVNHLFVNPWFTMLLHLQEIYVWYREGELGRKRAVKLLDEKLSDNPYYYDIYFAAKAWITAHMEDQKNERK